MRGCCCGGKLGLGINPRSSKSPDFLKKSCSEGGSSLEEPPQGMCVQGNQDDLHESALSLLPLPGPSGLLETSLLSALPSPEPAGEGKLLKYLLKKPLFLQDSPKSRILLRWVLTDD